MKNLLIEYPKCSTCQKAKKWLDDRNITYTDRHIVEDTPTEEELTKWIKQSNLDSKKFFNTSGLVYKEKKLKEKMSTLTEKEKIQLLASNGMLIKRPLLITDQCIFVGFHEEEWKKMK